jgi:hypothetical protein
MELVVIDHFSAALCIMNARLTVVNIYSDSKKRIRNGERMFEVRVTKYS